MLKIIGISIIFLLIFTACILGLIGLGIGIGESYRDKDWPGFFGMGSCFMLLLIILTLVTCAWIMCLVAGIKG